VTGGFKGAVRKRLKAAERVDGAVEAVSGRLALELKGCGPNSYLSLRSVDACLCCLGLHIAVCQGARCRNRSISLHVPVRSTAIDPPLPVSLPAVFIASYIAVSSWGRVVVVVALTMLPRVRCNCAIALHRNALPPSKRRLNLKTERKIRTTSKSVS
jgi:hypothetical protein